MKPVEESAGIFAYFSLLFSSIVTFSVIFPGQVAFAGHPIFAVKANSAPFLVDTNQFIEYEHPEIYNLTTDEYYRDHVLRSLSADFDFIDWEGFSDTHYYTFVDTRINADLTSKAGGSGKVIPAKVYYHPGANRIIHLVGVKGRYEYYHMTYKEPEEMFLPIPDQEYVFGMTLDTESFLNVRALVQSPGQAEPEEKTVFPFAKNSTSFLVISEDREVFLVPHSKVVGEIPCELLM